MLLIIWNLLALLLVSSIWGNQENLLQEAHDSYQQGEKAKTYEERKLAFNRALFLYGTLEQENDSPHPDLDQALANTYFQLGEYAWAILYYQRALKNNPDQGDLHSRLAQAQHKLGLSESPLTQNWLKPFLFLAKQFQLLFWIISISFLVLSLAIWFPFAWLRKLGALCACLLLFILSNALFIYYFTPLEGIIIKTTGFYRAPNWNEPQLSSQPLLAGSKIRIIQMTENKEWLKIENPAGVIGYIPAANLRPI